MGLKTMIGFQNSADNKVTVVQCDDTGLLESTGVTLNNTYNNLDSVKELIENGISNVDNSFGVIGTNLWSETYPTLEKFTKQHTSRYKYFYVYSEADNKWYVSSNDDKGFKPLTEELAKL